MVGVLAFFILLNMRNSFPKSERLKSRKLIDQLFTEGHTSFEYPLKLFYRQYPAESSRPKVKMGVSVPKRNFKKAVDRNRLKRQLREIYRLNKEAFYSLVENEGIVMDCMLIYIGQKKESYQKMQSALQCILTEKPIQ
jgi:ribonuclease P protein component